MSTKRKSQKCAQRRYGQKTLVFWLYRGPKCGFHKISNNKGLVLRSYEPRESLRLREELVEVGAYLRRVGAVGYQRMHCALKDCNLIQHNQLRVDALYRVKC